MRVRASESGVGENKGKTTEGENFDSRRGTREQRPLIWSTKRKGNRGKLKFFIKFLDASTRLSTRVCPVGPSRGFFTREISMETAVD